MAGSIVVDTNAVIAFRAGEKFITNLFLETERVYVPVVVLGELLYGARNSSKVQENLEAIKQFISHTALIAVDQATAYIYSEVRTLLKLIGKPIPENDLWIAATAIKLKIPLISNDRHFGNVKDLEVVRWIV